VSEKDIEIKVRLVLGADPVSVWWLNPTGFDHETKAHYGLFKGSSDIVGCFRGRFIGVELKTPIGRQSPDQKKWQATVEERGGGLYFLVRSEDDAHALLAELHRRFPA